MRTVALLCLALLLAFGCAQAPPRNDTNATPPAAPGAPPAQPPPAAPPVAPPVAPPPANQTPDEDMFSEDLGEALDDLDAVTDPGDLQQTSENTYCDSDDDCWCRIFNGAEFLPGKAGWSCDTLKKRCNRCIYY